MFSTLLFQRAIALSQIGLKFSFKLLEFSDFVVTPSNFVFRNCRTAAQLCALSARIAINCLISARENPDAAFAALIVGAQCRPSYKGETGLRCGTPVAKLATLIKPNSVDAQAVRTEFANRSFGCTPF